MTGQSYLRAPGAVNLEPGTASAIVSAVLVGSPRNDPSGTPTPPVP